MCINFAGVIAAVFFANILTASFIWAMSRISRTEGDIDWLVYAGAIMPLLAFLLSLIGGGHLPQFLAAMLAQ